MAHKVHPKIFRIGTTEKWNSVWFSLKNYPEKLKEDIKIRELLEKMFEKGIVEKVIIERKGTRIDIIIRTPRPGILIGKGGGGVEIISKKINDLLKSLNKNFKREVRIEVEEVREPTLSANLLAQQIASDIEKRISYKRAAKKILKRVEQRREIKGIKIKIKGRLDGVEIARSHLFKAGEMPLQTLRANIDYGTARAKCSYGIVGIKVWLYKGEKI